MKTLDETIELIEKALWCAYLPQDDTTTTAGLALHYLREYRAEKANLEITKNNYQDAIANCEKAENKFKTALKKLDIGTPNNPLTWEELKAMVGKPVWVEHKYYNKWLIVYEVYENTIVLDGNGCYTQFFSDDNDKEVRWQTYRKERS